jgi:hypothetical protein
LQYFGNDHSSKADCLYSKKAYAIHWRKEMNIQNLICVVLVIGAFTAGALRINANPGACPNDSKLLNGGPTAVYGDGDGTWWGLVIGGLNEAGLIGDDQKVAYLSEIFGIEFEDLDAAKQYNLDLLSHVFDANQDGYVCAYSLRGTRGQADDPYFNLTHFGVSDDRIR